MGLTAAGIGSNLPIETMISQLMSIEQQPIRTLDKKIAGIQSKISAIGTVKSALSAFQTAVKNLSEASKFSATTATSGNTAAFTGSATGAAAPASYSLEISHLAQAQKLAATGQASATAAIGSGTITIDLGTLAGGVFTPGGAAAKTVTIDPAGDTSLNGIRDAINSAKIGVTASIVNDGSGTPHRLVLTQEATGAANSMRISVTGDPALATLLNHDGVTGLEQTVNAQNAQFKLDGISVSSASNAVTTAIEGVTINLAKTNAGSPASLTVARDTAAINTAVKEFVTAYNTINKTLGDLTSYNPTTKTGGVLNGDSTIRGLQSQLRGILSAPVATGTSLTVLSDIGVSIKSGVMALDETALKKVIDTRFDDLAGLFADVGGVKGYAAQFNDWTTAVLKSDSAFMSRTEGLNTSIKSLEANKERINDRLADTEKRLRAQFSALDTMVAKMNSTSAYLAQQLAQLSNND